MLEKMTIIVIIIIIIIILIIIIIIIISLYRISIQFYSHFYKLFTSYIH